MRIGEGEVAAHRPDVADPHVGHVPGDRADQRAAGPNEWGPLDGPVRHGGADRDPRAIVVRAAGRRGVLPAEVRFQLDLGEPVDAFDVDEMARAEHAELHQEQQLGPAGVHRRILAELDQQRAGFFGGLGPMQGERPQHGQRPSAAAGRTISSAIIWRYSMRAFTSRGRL